MNPATIKHYEQLTSGELREHIEIAKGILEMRNHAIESRKKMTHEAERIARQ